MGQLEHVATTWFRWIIPTVMATTKAENPDGTAEQIADEFGQGISDSINGFLEIHAHMAEDSYEDALRLLNSFESNNLFGLLTQNGMMREFKAHMEEYLALAFLSRLKESPEVYTSVAHKMPEMRATAAPEPVTA